MNLPELPNINRARGFYLYDDRGSRFLDFYQNGGRALLGHRPAQLSTHLKSLLSKGLLAELPSKYAYRLEKALRKLLPDHPFVRCYEHRLKAEKVLVDAGISSGEVPVPEIVSVAGPPAGKIACWRPFLDGIVRFPEIVVPILPFPGGFGPGIVCFREDPGEILPPSDICSPFLLAGTVRIVYDLIGEQSARNRNEWNRFDGKGWKRIGPYLLPEGLSAEEYERKYGELLNSGFLFSPSYVTPSIIPGEFSSGEIDRLLRRM